MKRVSNAVFLIGLCLGSGFAWADVPITITATIIEPVCTVTDMAGSSTTNVVFDTVDITNLAAAVKTVDLKVTCDSVSPDKTLKVRVDPMSSAMSSLGNFVLGTSMADVGIALYQGAAVDSGHTLPLSTWVSFSGWPGGTAPTVTPATEGRFAVTAALTTAAGHTPTAGVFTSTASLMMDYQ